MSNEFDPSAPEMFSPVGEQREEPGDMIPSADQADRVIAALKAFEDNANAAIDRVNVIAEEHEQLKAAVSILTDRVSVLNATLATLNATPAANVPPAFVDSIICKHENRSDAGMCLACGEPA